jgi:hypothetical protein
MRYKIVLLLFVFWILFAAPAGAQAQDPWDNYRPRTLKQIIEPHAKLPLDKEVRDARIQLLFTADFPCRVKVTYTG